MINAEMRHICPALEPLLKRRPDLAETLECLHSHDLDQALLRYLPNASQELLARFLNDCSRIDFSRVDDHRRALHSSGVMALTPEDVAPVSMLTLEEQGERREQDSQAGAGALAEGRFASVAFAGGAGTRFFSGLDALQQALEHPNHKLRQGRFDPREPKGVFPISPVGGLSFYDLIIGEALRVGIKHGRLPWVLLLTSSVTHDRTQHFLRTADLWGLPPNAWRAFTQADEPRLDMQGHLVVEPEGGLAWTGDGHGGVYRALMNRGADGRSLHDILRADGVEHLVMHNVDNAVARPFVEARLGFHIRERALFTVSATRKINPEEKVGLLMRMRGSGRVEVVEYNVLSPEIANLRDPHTGRLVHEAGNINTNLVALDAVQEDIDTTLYTGKQIESCIGPVESSSLEMLNQHLTRLLDPDRVRAFEVERSELFMPTKNVTGVDSVVSTVQQMSDRSARLLRQAGATIADTALCDLGPACGDQAEDLKRYGIGPGWQLEPGAQLFACACQPDPEGPPIAESGLRLEENSSLLFSTQRPYGSLRLGPDRTLLRQPGSESKLHIGRDVVVRPGIRVRLDVGPGANLRVKDKACFSEDTEIVVPEGETLEIG
ncbi:MAG: UTP--glucose-1-phosphate uridylyltransferase [Deltaproteobacteria bacterium]|nr:UTP--glucose-1-phosphate uridylyltransferase [Deltaproteobacteria bacterium]